METGVVTGPTSVPEAGVVTGPMSERKVEDHSSSLQVTVSQELSKSTDPIGRMVADTMASPEQPRVDDINWPLVC